MLFRSVRKTHEYDRVFPLQLPVCITAIRGFFFPDGFPFKQVAPVGIFNGKKTFHRVHIEGFPKPAGAGNQGNFVRIFPPIPEKQGFIYIKKYFFSSFPHSFGIRCRSLASYPYLHSFTIHVSLIFHNSSLANLY